MHNKLTTRDSRWIAVPTPQQRTGTETGDHGGEIGEMAEASVATVHRHTGTYHHHHARSSRTTRHVRILPLVSLIDCASFPFFRSHQDPAGAVRHS